MLVTREHDKPMPTPTSPRWSKGDIVNGICLVVIGVCWLIGTVTVIVR